MPSLRETQLAFASAVFGEDARCMQGLVLEQRFSTEERLRVYRNNTRIGFQQALRATFPVVAQLGGAGWFDSAARRYQLQHPSRSGDLQYVGDRFAGFLLSDLGGSGYEWFAPVAELEWACQEVLVAPASQPFDPRALARLPASGQEGVAIMPRTEARLISTNVPVLAIWKAHQPGQGDQPVSLEAGEFHTLLVRRADHVEMRELPADQAALLADLWHGATLSEAQHRFAARFAGVDFAAALLRLARLDSLGALRHPFH